MTRSARLGATLPITPMSGCTAGRSRASSPTLATRSFWRLTWPEPPVGTLQLTLIPGMARRGAWRLQIEAVRVATHHRSSGIGTALMNWTVRVAAPALGATLVQLTSDRARADAHRFYERLGFRPSHTGFKLTLDTARQPGL
ncbi:GNAT family N-acetyltransferase [Pseudoclavibacter sp. Z016]|uniref:GNAT family N-acetyltransferase n=1 Tax=Pseudoclavibacter sp. Z016 TaxID=2080581 RepID=UPI0028006DD0|nr:GNAT family N-acetyltransferase [Pseudoclavibacter sp. Z016]